MDALDRIIAEAGARIMLQPVQGTGPAGDSITWDVLRTDLVHPICSGNKLFKIYPFLEDAIHKGYGKVRTFGGAWSNHILATAYASAACGLHSTGFIRGEKACEWSTTLSQAHDLGMELEFLDRTSFDQVSLGELSDSEVYTIPMGGRGTLGARGAGKMLQFVEASGYSHIFCAAGTGTMLAGLALASGKARLCAVNVVKGHDAALTLAELAPGKKAEIYDQYGFGGYAKTNGLLLDFMNLFFQQNRIPTDIVYTGKLMFAINDLLRLNAFPPESRILAIHSGGLQGNKSLKKGVLIF
jgi:1-aminocyclopropane-1-carboxylate deaminase